MSDLPLPFLGCRAYTLMYHWCMVRFIGLNLAAPEHASVHTLNTTMLK